jgi:hypothetical protein
MLHVPAKIEFPKSARESQGAWLNTLKTGGCVGCHPAARRGACPNVQRRIHDPVDAWTRIQAGGAQSQAQKWRYRSPPRAHAVRQLDRRTPAP